MPEILLLAPDMADSKSLRKPDELPFRLITAEPMTDSANFYLLLLLLFRRFCCFEFLDFFHYFSSTRL